MHCNMCSQHVYIYECRFTEEEFEEEWYDESPEPEPLSPATEKRLNDEFKGDVDECTTDSDFTKLCQARKGRP